MVVGVGGVWMCGCMVGVDDDVVVGCGFGNDCGGGVGCV